MFPQIPQNESQGTSLPVVQSATNNRTTAYCHAGATGPTDRNSERLGEYWRVLWRGKLLLLLTTLLGGGVAILLTLLQVPVYRAHTLLEVQNLNDDFLNMRNLSPTVSSSDSQSPEYSIRTQAMVVQSRPVVERAINKLNLQNRSLASSNGVVQTFNWRRVLHILRSPPPAQHEQDLARAEEGLAAAPEPNTRVIKLSFDSTDRSLAADFVNLVADEFIQLSFETREQASRDTVEWLMRQMGSLKAKLETAEAEFQRFTGSSNLTILSEKENVDDARLRDVQAALTKTQTEVIAKQSKYELASTAPRESLPEILDDSTLKEYQLELTTLRRQLAELMSEFTPEHPRVKKVQAQITILEAAFEEKRNDVVTRIRNEFVDAQRRESLLTGSYNNQAGHLAKQADEMAHYSMLKREVDTTRALYDSMLQKVTEAGLASAMRTNNIHVIERATPPEFPVTPSPLLNITFGLFTGLCLGIAFVIQRARSDRGIQEPGDITLHLNVPELGVIPASGNETYRVPRLLPGRLRSQTLGLDGNVGERLELTTSQQRPSVIAESFRLTLTSILFSRQKGLRLGLIAISSANPQEGKTTVVSNLGIALAQTNQKVLLIDGDTRRPRLHEIFGSDNSVGLCDVLSGKASPLLRETKIPNLFVLPSGHTDDTALLFKPELPALLDRLRAEFDMIIIDTPPMLQMPDARLFGRHADAVILVVAQHTNRTLIQIASQRLAEDGSLLLGTILNNWNPKDITHRSSEYRDHYQSYFRDPTR